MPPSRRRGPAPISHERQPDDESIPSAPHTAARPVAMRKRSPDCRDRSRSNAPPSVPGGDRSRTPASRPRRGRGCGDGWSGPTVLCFNAFWKSSASETGGRDSCCASSGLNVDREPHASGIADVGQRPVPFERLELVGERNQRPAAAFEHVAIGRAQRADERRRRVAALIDEVRERVEIVEEEVRIDLASEAFELGLEARLFQPGAAHRDRSPSRAAGTRSRRRG